jgi:hypothetical protein
MECKIKFKIYLSSNERRERVENIVNIKMIIEGRAIAKAVCRRLHSTAAPVRDLSGHVGFVVHRMALGHVFSEYFGFPCQSSFHQILHPHNHPG